MAAPTATMHIVFNKFPDLARKAPKKAKELVEKATFEFEARAKSGMVGQGPSAPGHPPAVDTGNLKNSIRTSFEKDGMVGVISTNVEYSVYLEFGTVKMAARPFFTPAAEQVRPSFERAVRDGLVKL